MNSITKRMRDNKTLVTRLIIPLLAVAVISFFLSRPFDRQATFINLMTDALAIIVTVFYVDWVIRMHEERKWNVAEKYIDAEFGKFAHGMIATIASHTGLDKKLLPIPKTIDVKQVQEEIINQTGHLSVNEIEISIRAMNDPVWDDLIKAVDDKNTETTNLINLFGQRLDPDQLATVLRLRYLFDLLSATNMIFRAVSKSPIYEIPISPKRESRDYPEIMLGNISIELHLILQQCLVIIKAFEYEIIEPDLDFDSYIEDYPI